MPLELQTKLLRLVQTGGYQKVGSDRQEAADIRFVCATNRDPWQEVEAGRFREDLYYRMHVIPIELPPLRARDGDVAILAAHFLAEYSREEKKAFSGFAPGAEAALIAHEWPGNVRELQNTIRRIVVLNDGEIVTADMLPPLITHATAAIRTLGEARGNGARRAFAPRGLSEPVRPLWLVEREAIEQAIESCGGNLRQAAELLGIDRATIYRKRRMWKKAVPDSKEGAAALSLDHAALRALEKALGTGTMRGLVARHIGDFGERLKLLQGPVIKQGTAVLAREAHDIKNLAAAFGAVVVQAIAEEVERACDEEDLARARGLVPRLAEAAETALSALAKRYGVTPAG